MDSSGSSGHFSGAPVPKLTSSLIRNRIRSRRILIRPPHPHSAVATLRSPTFRTKPPTTYNIVSPKSKHSPKCLPRQRPTSSISTAPSSASFLPGPSSPPRAPLSISASVTSSNKPPLPPPPALPHPSTSHRSPKPSSSLPTSRRSANTSLCWSATTPAWAWTRRRGSG